jgi:hypothetical protein
MKLSMRSIKFIGYIIALPVRLLFSKRIRAEQEDAFDRHQATFHACRDCHRMFAQFPVRLGKHIQAAHGLTARETRLVVDEMYRRLSPKISAKRA